STTPRGRSSRPHLQVGQAVQAGRARLRRRSETRPTAVRAATTATSPSNGAAVTGTAGALGTWVNGDRSCAHWGTFRAGPNSGPIRMDAISTAQDTAPAARWSRPTAAM